jgi:hypothetical protein
MGERVNVHPGALPVCGLFALTIFMSAFMQSYVELPPVLGMMTGLALLMVRASHRGALFRASSTAYRAAGPVGWSQFTNVTH